MPPKKKPQPGPKPIPKPYHQEVSEEKQGQRDWITKLENDEDQIYQDIASLEQQLKDKKIDLENKKVELEENRDLQVGQKSSWYLFRTAKSMFSINFGSKKHIYQGPPCITPLRQPKIHKTKLFRLPR